MRYIYTNQLNNQIMTSRRSFLKSSAMLSAGLLMAPELFAAHKKRYVGVQLYTVRDAMAKDPLATLAKVAKVGFNSVEGATYTGTQKFYGMEPAEFKKVLSDNGLIMPSGHFMLGEGMPDTTKGTIVNEWQKAVDDAAAVGLKYMVCAYLLDSERGTLDHYKETADKLNKAGEIAKKAGIQLCYHNHDFEFASQDGKYPYDVFEQYRCGPGKNGNGSVLDVQAKQDPIAMLRNTRAVSRCGMLKIWITPRNKCLPKLVMVLFLSKRSLPMLKPNQA
jgi:hypothetical protein